MEQLFIQQLTVRIADVFNYSWVIMDEQATREQFIDSLNDSQFHEVLRQNKIKNIVLDCVNMWNFGIPEMSDYLANDFSKAMQYAGLEKASVVLNDQVLMLMSSIFDSIQHKYAQTSTQIRFFYPSQFHEGWDAVNCF